MANGNDGDTDLQEMEEGGVPDTGEDQPRPSGPLAGGGDPITGGVLGVPPVNQPQPRGPDQDLGEYQQDLGGGFFGGAGAVGRALARGIGFPAPPVGNAIQQRHQGLLTGLAGVLLDGIAAGVAAPDKQTAYQMGLQFAAQRQAQQQAQQQQTQGAIQGLTPAQQTTLKQNQAQIKQMHGKNMIAQLDPEQAAAAAKPYVNFMNQLRDQGMFSMLEQTGSAGTAAQSANWYRMQNQGQAGARTVWSAPFGQDEEGTVDDYGVFEYDPNAKLEKDMTVPIGEFPDENGKVKTQNYTFPAGTSMGDVMAYSHDLFESGAHNLALQREEDLGKLTPAQSEELAWRNWSPSHPGVDRVQFHGMWAGAAAGEKAASNAVVVAMPDGSQQVMTQADAQTNAPNQFHYPLKDPMQITTAAMALNDVQSKINQLAQVNYSNVQPELAAALLEDGEHGDDFKSLIHIPVPARLTEGLRAENLRAANQDTKDYVAAMDSAFEAVDRLPSLQTFGRQNRINQKQAEDAKKLLPLPGETSDPSFAMQKMQSLQGMIDPIRRGLPRMPGAELTPTWTQGGRAQPGTVRGGGASGTAGAIQIVPGESVLNGPDGRRAVIRNGKWVDIQTGAPVE